MKNDLPTWQNVKGFHNSNKYQNLDFYYHLKNINFTTTLRIFQNLILSTSSGHRQIGSRFGNPHEIRGDEQLILEYPQGRFRVELYFSPRLSAVKQIMPGAELDLLT